MLPADTAAAPPPGPLRTALATLVGNLYLVAGTLLFSAAAIVAALVPPRGRHAHALGRLWARGALAASGVTLRHEHEVPLGRDERYVFLARAGGRFEPRRVRFGRQEGEWVEILAGVAAGDTVVSSASFLIDSESRLKAALEGMGAAADPHAGHGGAK